MSLKKPNGAHDYAGWVAVILALALSIVFVGTFVAVAFLDHPIGEEAQRLLTTIGVGLIGALAAYVGTAARHRDRDDDKGP